MCAIYEVIVIGLQNDEIELFNEYIFFAKFMFNLFPKDFGCIPL